MKQKAFPKCRFTSKWTLLASRGQRVEEGCGAWCASGEALGHTIKVSGNQLLQEIGADLSRKQIWLRL